MYMRLTCHELLIRTHYLYTNIRTGLARRLSSTSLHPYQHQHLYQLQFQRQRQLSRQHQFEYQQSPSPAPRMAELAAAAYCGKTSTSQLPVFRRSLLLQNLHQRTVAARHALSRCQVTYVDAYACIYVRIGAIILLHVWGCVRPCIYTSDCVYVFMCVYA